jgi:hypothetical protein
MATWRGAFLWRQPERDNWAAWERPTAFSVVYISIQYT